MGKETERRDRRTKEERRGAVDLLTTDQALKYCKDNGLTMSRATFFRALQPSGSSRMADLPSVQVGWQRVLTMENLSRWVEVQKDRARFYDITKDVTLTAPSEDSE